MFMGKDELRNLLHLIKVKLNINKTAIITFIILVAVFYIGNLIPTIIKIQQGNLTGSTHFVQDLSFSFFLGIIMWLFIMELSYGQSNNFLGVFPQTNTTRFMSSQILHYCMIITIALLFLVMYCLQFAFMKVFTANQENIILVPDFDLGTIISGFFVYILYLFLISSIIAFGGVMVRKFRFYAMALPIVVLVLILTNITKAGSLISQAFTFITSESSLPLFFIKGVLLWIIIVTLSIWINKHTVYYKNKDNSISMVVAGVIILLSIITIPSILFMATEYGGGNIEEMDPWEDYQKITYDISQLEKGSHIQLITNEHVEKLEYNKEYQVESSTLYVNNYEVLDSIQGDTLYIYYRLPDEVRNGFNLTNLMEHNLTASLRGNKLTIDYTYDENRQAIILPIWTMAGQFNEFYSQYRSQDTDHYTNSFGFFYSGSRMGSIHLNIE